MYQMKFKHSCEEEGDLGYLLVFYTCAAGPGMSVCLEKIYSRLCRKYIDVIFVTSMNKIYQVVQKNKVNVIEHLLEAVSLF